MLKKRGIDVVVALDFSKSMLAQDIQPSRLERAKLELADFIERLTGGQLSLFGDQPAFTSRKRYGPHEPIPPVP